MSGFEVAVTDLAARQLVGIKVRTSMTNAKQDCPALWQSFCPKMPDLFGKQSYGISVMLNEQDFDYWAAAEAPAGACPAGFEPVGIPAGAYVRCQVPNLESIGAGYMYMYQTWLAAQSEWKLNIMAPCFELYPAGWNPSMPFELFVGVTK